MISKDIFGSFQRLSGRQPEEGEFRYMNKMTNKKEKIHSMVDNLSRGINIINNIGYINLMVGGCRKRSGRSMVEQLSNKQYPFPRMSGFDSQPDRLQFSSLGVI